MASWFARWVNRNMPTRESMEQNKYLRPIAHRILRSELWRFTRRSVPRGVALGLLAGFLVPLGQIFVAAFLALPVRANVPIAALMTFITNPFTYPLWVVFANRVGMFLLQIDEMIGTHQMKGHVEGNVGNWLSWFLQAAGVTAFGFIVIGVVSASIGYLVSALCWRWWVKRKRTTRLEQIAIRRRKKQEKTA